MSNSTNSSSNYSTSRWEDLGPLLSGGGKPFVRKATRKGGAGDVAVVKHFSGNQARFFEEAANMRRLTGTPGILPVLDMDDSVPGRPKWYAMPRAVLLADGLGDGATLRDVVRAIAFLADVLARLALDEGTYHRDIKPANLFWWSEGPVLADFGIAAWRTRDDPQAGATSRKERVGPANFIAPEMRHNRPANRGRQADVYSLAKTLFVLALPHRGPYPPDGTHRTDSEEFLMGETGGRHSLGELGHVLEAATEFNPRHRLSMADFRDELYTWLNRYPEVQFRRRGDLVNYLRRGFTPRTSRYSRDREATEKIMKGRIERIAEALTEDEGAWVSEDGEGSGEVLGDYAWKPNSEDGFVPEGWVWLATKVSGGRRVILWAVLDDDVCFVAESQTGGPPWTLEKQWGHTAWERPRMPRTADQLERLTNEVIGWIATATSQSGS